MKKRFWPRFVVTRLFTLFVVGSLFMGLGFADSAQGISGGTVKINEVMFAPTDSIEWVELYNGGPNAVDLSGWIISDEDGEAEYEFSDSLELPRDSYLLIRSDEGADETDFSDNQGVIYANHGSDYANTMDQVALYDEAGQIIDFVAWGNIPGADGQVALEANIWPEDNFVIISDLQNGESIGLVSNGEDNNSLSDWQKYTLATPGESNEAAAVEYSDKIRLNEILPNPSTTENTDEYIELYNAGEEVVDLAGWILEDSSGDTYTISGSNLDSTRVAAGDYLTVYRRHSGLALNNNGDSLKLYQPDDNLLDSVTYSESVEDDVSYNFADGSWQWSIKPTPGLVNEIEQANNEPEALAGSDQTVEVDEQVVFDASESSDPDGDELTCFWDFGDGYQSSDCQTQHAYQESGSYDVQLTVRDDRGGSNDDSVRIEVKATKENEEDEEEVFEDESTLETKTTNEQKPGVTTKDSTPTQESDQGGDDEYESLTIEQAKQKGKNTKVEITGVVTVVPGILSETYFYLQDKTGGIKIYFSKKDFPKLILGDKVEVRGKVSERSGEKKINISDTSDIEVGGKGGKVQPMTVKTGQITEDRTGQLIKTSGEIVKSSGSTVYIDDGSGEIKVSILKTAGLDKPKWSKGDEITITGIVGRTSSGLRIIPRYQGDLVAGEEQVEATKDGEVAKVDEANVPEGDIPAAGSGIFSGFLLSLLMIVARRGH